MQTSIISEYLDTAKGQEADRILRSCVHCGFCTATCPTYQLLGNELDSPRGRIYLIKQMLEGKEVSDKTQLHLDRCLTCRSCETTCPSGVQYGRLVDIGRELANEKLPRSMTEKLLRYGLRKMIPYPARFASLIKLGNVFKPVLPAAIGKKIPQLSKSYTWPAKKHARRMLVLEGCAQKVVSAETNRAAARILDRMGVELLTAKSSGCCGAVSHHLSATEEGLDFMRRNVDAWWPYVEQDIEAIVITASGCGVVVKDYGPLLAHDASYADKAAKISSLAKDIGEVLSNEDLSILNANVDNRKVAFHSPCTLQHGQKLNGVVESILRRIGFNLTEVADAHLCCGSAGTYSILQSEISQQLLNNKVSALQQDEPDVIATANIGCQMHISSRADVAVKHWIELIDEAIN